MRGLVSGLRGGLPNARAGDISNKKGGVKTIKKPPLRRAGDGPPDGGF